MDTELVIGKTKIRVFESGYIPVADTAKLIRPLLKAAFPGVKFSVKSDSYAGGASIDISWTDGPSKKAVEKIAKPFAGAGFDGMIDMKYSKSAWLLPDGTATWGSSSGTGDSRGSEPGYKYEKPHPDAKKVHFGSDYVFCTKAHSKEKYEAAAVEAAKYWGVPVIPVVECSWGYKLDVDPYIEHAGAYFSALVHRELEKENH